MIILCCSQDDLEWILNLFMRKRPSDRTKLDIEIDHGFRLFLHQRDFLAGYSIAHCINHGIEKSRRVIFVLSRWNFRCCCFHTHLLQCCFSQTAKYLFLTEPCDIRIAEISGSTSACNLCIAEISWSPSGEWKNSHLHMLKPWKTPKQILSLLFSKKSWTWIPWGKISKCFWQRTTTLMPQAELSRCLTGSGEGNSFHTWIVCEIFCFAFIVCSMCWSRKPVFGHQVYNASSTTEKPKTRAVQWRTDHWCIHPWRRWRRGTFEGTYIFAEQNFFCCLSCCVHFFQRTQHIYFARE